MGDTRGNHLLLIRDGAAFACGGSELYEEGEAFIGHLGHGEDWGEHVLSPRRMLFALACPARVVQVAAGSLHSLVLCEDGSLFSCGGGWEGVLGLGREASEARLTPVAALACQKVVAVAAGAAHSLAITDRGALFSWGWGKMGQLGHEGDRSELLPRRLTVLAAVHVRRIEAGPTHSICTGGDGVAYAFGTTPLGAALRLAVTNHTELSYEPRARYAALARRLRVPRGAKSVEHLRILRTSKPTYGSLTPSLTQPSARELSYDPCARYAALAKQLRVPRGAKSVEHLRILRTSDPCRGGRPAVPQPPASPDAASAAPSTAAASGMMRAVSLTELSQLMTRSFSVDSWLCADETEELPELPSCARRLPQERMRWWRHARSEEGFDCASEEEDSERSAARTHERISNQTEEDDGSCVSFEAEPSPTSTKAEQPPATKGKRRAGFEGRPRILH